MNSKNVALRRMRKLRDIINACDPVGLMACGCPDDEYECLIPMVFRQLQTARTPFEMAAELGPHIEQHFGITPDKEVLDGLLERATNWYRGATENPNG